MDDHELDLSPEMAAQWKALRHKGVAIPQQPGVLLQIEKLGSSPGFQARRLAGLIRQDPGLTARLLYIVNSPAYGLVDEVENIENAVIILGAERTLNLCRAALLRGAIGSLQPALETFWDRSAIVAELTAAIAFRQRTGSGNDLAYLAGLFHACGIAVLANSLPGYGEALMDQGAWARLAEHDRRFGVDHVVVSYLVSRYWRLPERVVEVVLHQRGDGDCRHECAGLVASLQLALLIYNRSFLGSQTSEWEPGLDRSLAALGMTREELARFA